MAWMKLLNKDVEWEETPTFKKETQKESLRRRQLKEQGPRPGAKTGLE